MRDNRLKLRIQRLPSLQGYDAFSRTVRLIEARPIIERRHAVETERDVGAGTYKFRRIDQAGLQATEDFRWWRGLRRPTEAAKHFAAQAESADFQPADVFSTGNLAPKPATHANAGIAAHERLHAERRVNLIPQCLTTAGIHP